MISPELLSAVLEKDVKKCSLMNKHTLHVNITHYPHEDLNYTEVFSINIYELRHMMKEWIWSKDEDFSITYHTSGRKRKRVNFDFHNEYSIDYYHYKADNNVLCEDETEAVTKACEWILNEVSK